MTTMTITLAPQVQEISSQPGSILAEHIRVINSCYPEEIVRYMSVSPLKSDL